MRDRIDIHSHMIPGVDDGCRELDESLASIAMLKEAGFVGSICTPHIWPRTYPGNTPDRIARWTHELKAALADHGIDYRLWPGGELRLFDGVIDWLGQAGVPTLADSSCVLCDFWEPRWPRWVDQALTWLLREGYTPILAHPERLSMKNVPTRKLDEAADRGVLLQGNFRCLTGGDGVAARQRIQRWLQEDRYTLLALDMHRPDALADRLEGMAMAEAAVGREKLDELTVHAPRHLIFSQ